MCVHLQMGRRFGLEVYEWLLYEVGRGSWRPALHVPDDAVDLFCRPCKVLKKVFGTGLMACWDLVKLCSQVGTS